MNNKYVLELSYGGIKIWLVQRYREKKVSIRWDRLARTFTLESLEIVCHVLPRLAVANGEILSQSMIKWRDSRWATRSFKSSPREWLVEGKHRLGSFLETRPWMSCAFLASNMPWTRASRRGGERRKGERRGDSVREKLFSLSTCAETRLFSFAIYASNPLIVWENILSKQ